VVNQKTGLGEFLYLSVSDGEGNSKRIDSFKVEDNKKPTIFIVDNDTSKMYSITSSFNNYKIDFIKDNKVVNINADFFNRTNEISNSPATQSISKFNTEQGKLISQLSVLEKNNFPNQKILIYSLRKKIAKNYINYADSVKNATAFMIVYNHVDFGNNYNSLAKFISRAKVKFNSYKAFIVLEKKVQNYLSVMKEELVVGDKFPDFKLPDVNGMESVLTDKQKFTFVDFWASWNPHALAYTKPKIEIFNTIDKSKLKMVSVALEPDKREWANYLKSNKITWKNLIDVDMWNGKAINIVKFDSVPSNYLVAPNGKIVAKAIHPDSLFRVLKRYIK
jgi:Thioredoxin-like